MMKHPLRPGPVTQEWTWGISHMQQSVLFSAIRGCDGMPKCHKHKPLMKWFRRCVLLSAFDKKALTDPFAPGGGSFTGPMYEAPPWVDDENEATIWRTERLVMAVDDFLDSRDELPSHYYEHAMHAFEILGYKHPEPWIRTFWHDVYMRMVVAKHLWPEMESDMDARLGDDEAGWRARCDRSAACTD